MEKELTLTPKTEEIIEIKNSKIMCNMLLMGFLGCELQQTKVKDLLDLGQNNISTYFKKQETAGFITSKWGKVNKPRTPGIDKRTKVSNINYAGKGFQKIFRMQYLSSIDYEVENLFSTPEIRTLLKRFYSPLSYDYALKFCPNCQGIDLTKIYNVYNKPKYSEEDKLQMQKLYDFTRYGDIILFWPMNFLIDVLLRVDKDQFKRQIAYFDKGEHTEFSHCLKELYELKTDSDIPKGLDFCSIKEMINKS